MHKSFSTETFMGMEQGDNEKIIKIEISLLIISW